MGSQRQAEILQRIAAGRMLEGDLERLQDVGWTMTDASLCGLGQTAASAVLSAIKLWPEMFVQNEKAQATGKIKAKKPVSVKTVKSAKKKTGKTGVKKTKPKLKSKPAKTRKPAGTKAKASRKPTKH
jgi:hypothetical protein